MLAQVRNNVLFRSRRLNVYFVRYREGHKVVPHVDMIAAGRLYKLNCVLRQPRKGGRFECESSLFNLFDRIVLFRPDLHRHSVSTIERGSRWLLSFAFTTGSHQTD